MDYRILILLALWAGLRGASINAQEKADIIPVVRTVHINHEDTMLEVSVCVRRAYDKKLKPDAMYHWYAFDQVHVNQGSYAGNLLHGVCKMYDNQDRLIEQGQYHYGLKDGFWYQWDKQGLKKAVTTYRKGLKDGTAYFYNKGQLIRSEQYQDGLLHGKVQAQLPDGKQQVQKYRKGQLVPEKEKKAEQKDSRTKQWIRKITAKKERPEKEKAEEPEVRKAARKERKEQRRKAKLKPEKPRDEQPV